MLTVGVFKARQDLLIRKHESARNRSDSLSVGGGVSLWPDMQRMRLTRAEGGALVVISMALVVLSVIVFTLIHGKYVRYNCTIFKLVLFFSLIFFF